MKKLDAHWDKLRIFYHVAKLGSFKAAAENLNISQPALSRTISLLETYLDVLLFERLPRGVILTRQGDILFQTIQTMSHILDEAQSRLEEEETEPTGILRLAATAGFASLHLSELLPPFLQQYPKIQLSISGDDHLPNLHSDEADALVAPFIQDDSSLIQTHITTYHLKLYASPDYIRHFGMPQKPSDLSAHRLLAFGDHKTLHPFAQANWHLSLGRPKGELHRPYIMINSAVGLFNFASAGLGIASLSEEHPPLKNSSLIQILPELPSPKIEAYFIHSVRLQNVKKVQLIKDFLINAFNPPLTLREPLLRRIL